jgi:menaquinone-dependent protoporphyrinogen oxidase
MARVLVVHASTHGHTARIAATIGEALSAAGCAVDRLAPDDDGGVAVSHYDGVIVGGSVHGGRHQRELVEWASHHRYALASVPSAFFSVSLAAADPGDEGRETARRYIDEFVEDTGWSPDVVATFAGALRYREYDFLLRLVMRIIAHEHGRPEDTSRDHDLTDWAAVDAFARAFAARVEHAPAAA